MGTRHWQSPCRSAATEKYDPRRVLELRGELRVVGGLLSWCSILWLNMRWLAANRFCELVGAYVALVKSSIWGKSEEEVNLTSMFIMMHSDRFSGSLYLCVRNIGDGCVHLWWCWKIYGSTFTALDRLKLATWAIKWKMVLTLKTGFYVKNHPRTTISCGLVSQAKKRPIHSIQLNTG